MTTGDTQQAGNTNARRFKFREAVISDIGCRRKENQDAFGISHTGLVSLYVVADGMGGARGGATASSLAVSIVTQDAFLDDGTMTLSSLKSAIELANKLVFQRSSIEEELQGMGTTIVALAFVGETVVVAHVGDSRIYRLRDGKLQTLTKDHTLVQELVDTGAIAPEEAANHPIAHMLTRSLGPTESMEVEIRLLPDPGRAGDRYLLCSDGLYNLVLDEEIADNLANKPIDQAVKTLVELALERGGTDNVTVQIVEAVESADESLSVEYPTADTVKCQLSTNAEVGDVPSLMKAAKEEEQHITAAATETSVEPPPPSDEQPQVEKTANTTEVEPEVPQVTAAETEKKEDALAVEEQVAPKEPEEPASPEIFEEFSIPMPENVSVDEFVSLDSSISTELGEFDISEGQQEFTDREPESEALRQYEKAYQQENEELTKIQYFIAGLLLLILVGIGFALMKTRSTTQRPDLQLQLTQRPKPAEIAPMRTVGPDALRKEIAVWAAQRQTVAPDETESMKSRKQMEPQTNENPVTVVVPTPAEVALEPTRSMPVPTAEASMSPSETAVEPNADDLAAILGKKNENPAKNEETVTADAQASPTPVPGATQEDPDEDALLAMQMLKDRVNDLAVPPAPKVRITDEQAVASKADQPIVWENETERVGKMLEQAKSSEGAQTLTAEQEKPERVLSKEEVSKLLDDKNETRSKISDLDAKVESLALVSQTALKEKRNQLKTELDTAERVLKKTGEDIAQTKSQLNMWLGFKREAADKNKVKLADRIADYAEDVKKKKEEYTEASAKYLDAVDHWQQMPNDVDLASKMGSFGRTMQKKRVELEQSVTIAIAENVEQLVVQLAENQVTFDNLTRYNNQLNKHLGFLAHPAPMKAERRKELQKTYDKERADLVEKLKVLQRDLSDEQESDFRREKNAGEVRLEGAQ